MGDFLRHLYDKCIFCGKPLPEEYDGEGEHPFPKNLGSSWHIDVVCADCRQHFGDNVDHLGISNPYILEAMRSLGWDGVDDHIRRIPHSANDVLTGDPVEMVRDGGDFRTRMICTDDPLDGTTVPGALFERQLRRCANTLLGQNISPDAIEEEIQDLLKWERVANPGDIRPSKVFDTNFQKMTAKGVRIDISRLKSLSPLVAKILVCSVHMFLAPDHLEAVKDLGLFIGHARFGQELPHHLLGRIHPRGEDWPPAQRLHYVFLQFFPHAIICDVIFFGTVFWQALLSTSDTIQIQDPQGVIS